MIPEYAIARFPSPIGTLVAVASPRGLAYLGTPGERPERFAAWAQRRLAGAKEVESLPTLDLARVQLAEYFALERRAFDLPIDVGGTPFQELVWNEVRAIPFGATATYSGLAQRLGRPGAERAVGAANGANAVAIVVPCHRVVGADGALTGYAGGMRTKAHLLDHEKRARFGKVQRLDAWT